MIHTGTYTERYRIGDAKADQIIDCLRLKGWEIVLRPNDTKERIYEDTQLGIDAWLEGYRGKPLSKKSLQIKSRNSGATKYYNDIECDTNGKFLVALWQPYYGIGNPNTFPGRDYKYQPTDLTIVGFSDVIYAYRTRDMIDLLLPTTDLLRTNDLSLLNPVLPVRIDSKAKEATIFLRYMLDKGNDKHRGEPKILAYVDPKMVKCIWNKSI